MLAAVYHGRNDVRVEDWPAPPAPPPGWVTVAVSWCGICGTDVDEILRGPVFIPTQPHPLTGARPPLVLGHEAMGTVIAEGAGARLPVGTRVGLENTIGCSHCAHCRAGNAQLCEATASIGLMADGALAEKVNVPAGMCAVLAPGLSDEAGALAEPLSVAVRALRQGGGVRGRSVQVFGAGTIGLMVASLAVLEGADSVVVRDVSEARVARAATMSLAAAGPDAEVPAAAVVFECTGVPAGFAAAITATARSGVTVLVGIHAQPQPLNLQSMVFEERSLVASMSHSMVEDYGPAIELLNRGELDFDALVTDRVPLRRVIEAGFTPLIENPDQHLKVLVDCRG